MGLGGNSRGWGTTKEAMFGTRGTTKRQCFEFLRTAFKCFSPQ